MTPGQRTARMVARRVRTEAFPKTPRPSPVRGAGAPSAAANQSRPMGGSDSRHDRVSRCFRRRDRMSWRFDMMLAYRNWARRRPPVARYLGRARRRRQGRIRRRAAPRGSDARSVRWRSAESAGQLRQVVADGVPWRLRRHVQVQRRPHRWIVVEPHPFQAGAARQTLRAEMRQRRRQSRQPTIGCRGQRSRATAFLASFHPHRRAPSRSLTSSCSGITVSTNGSPGSTTPSRRAAARQILGGRKTKIV